MRTETRNLLMGFALAMALFALTASYAILPLTTSLPPSPDESSNALFSKDFSENGMLWDVDPINGIANGVVHPRSVRVVDDLLVPGGFLGLPTIYGGIGRLFGSAVIPFLTPVFALFGMLAWWGLARHVFGERIGFYSAIILAVHPVWWYVASRTMMPNTLFVSLALASAYFGVVAPFKAMIEKRGLDGLQLLRRADPAISGILFALALAVRPSEIHWMAFAFLAIAIPACKEAAGRYRVAIFLVAMSFAVAPFLLLQHSIYGSVFSSGYGQGVDVPMGGAMQGRGNAMLGPIRPYLFPLGFAPMNVMRNVFSYGISLFWWWTIVVVLGIVAARQKLRTATLLQNRFFVIAVAVSGWIAIFYGSWFIGDSPDPTAVTIGSSYLRYGLPIFILTTIPAAYLIDYLVTRFSSRRPRLGLAAAWTVLMLIGLFSVAFAPSEGWRAMMRVDQRYELIVADIVSMVPANGLVIADRADKYFLGKRRVMSPLRADSTYDNLPLLARRSQVFYFGLTLPPVDLEYLRTTILAPRGLMIDPLKTYETETLYSISLKDKVTPP